MLLRQPLKPTANGVTFPFDDYAIADRDSYRLTSGMLVQDRWDSNTMMAPGAGALCSGLSPLHCWNLPGGEVIPLAPSLADYVVSQASRSSRRVIAERWAFRWWDVTHEVPFMSSRIVVDLRSGRRIASLKPREQPGYRPLDFGGDSYFKCALSSAGDLLAEGGDGSLTLIDFREPRPLPA
jgi:hypothetical protein